MKRCCLLFLVISAFLAPSYAFAEETPDPRLSQPVTLQCGNVRFYSTVAELSQLTGVKISCGKTKDDWRVRDIPVSMAVRDMPLVTLLNKLAWTTHTACTRTDRKGQKPSYSFHGDSKLQKDFLGPLKAQMRANRATAEWAWDVLVQYAGMPDASDSLNAHNVKRYGFDATQIRLVARLLAALGPAAKQKVFGGELIKLKLDGPQSQVLKELYESAWTSTNAHLGANFNQVTEADMQQAAVWIKLRKTTSLNDNGGLQLELSPIRPRLEPERLLEYNGWDGRPIRMARALQSCKELNIAPAPDAGFDPRKLDENPPDGFRLLKEVEDWKLPALQAKVQSDDEITEESRDRGKILSALSQASGLNIICEDFTGYRSRALTHYPMADTVAGKFLRIYDLNCFIDERDKILLGRGRNWRYRHLDMIPENLVKAIDTKRATSGVELDDVIPLVWMPSAQYTHWTAAWRDTLVSGFVPAQTNTWLWRIYDCLDSSDKEQARSDTGVSLSKFRPRQLLDFIHGDKLDSINNLSAVSVDGSGVEDSSAEATLSDPKVVSTLVLRVVQLPAEILPGLKRPSDVREDDKTWAHNIPRHTYECQLAGEEDGQPIRVTSKWRLSYFPNYDWERELELLKEMKDK